MSGSNRPVLVLDTNVILDLLHWRDPGVAHIARAIEAGQVACVTRADCFDELARVLCYRRFGISPEAASAILERWHALATRVEAPPPNERLPRCADPDDQKFLELAWAAGADFLVTKDKALLRLDRRVRREAPGRPRILTPAALVLEGREGAA
jgi:putative PIN family toxin of toxin-antitoxin system